MENLEVQLVRPPVPVRRATAGRVFVSSARYRALAIFIHNVYSFRCVKREAAVNPISPAGNRDKARRSQAGG